MTARRIAQILLVDDDPGLLKLLSMRLQAAGYRVEPAASATAAVGKLAQFRPDVIITDLRMENMDGMALLREAGARATGVPVIIITAHGTIPDAVAAVQQGAFGFLTKPVDRAELLSLVERALRASAAVSADTSTIGVATRNPHMNDLLAQARMVAAGEASVLILGESGTGKEVLAHAIHGWSQRSEGPFVAINCSAIPSELMEAELFGYQKGAFTGANRDHLGLLQGARGGTVFLDEVGDMPLALQAKLLRVIEDRQVRPIGGIRDVSLDIRVLSATHRDLADAIRSGAFREDLFYRLNVVSLEMPPLRERREDIPLLVQHMLAGFGGDDPVRQKVYAPEAMELLVGADWPGNIRQLRNVVEQTVALSPAPVIGAQLVSRALGTDAGSGIAPFAEARDEFTRQYLVQLLHLTGGRVSQAARLAQRNRTEFYKLLTRYEIDLERFKSGGSPSNDS
ncbi:MAG: sigma 54-interacting transcriptional regulator [Xanthomonadaceae bacterium]|nr:sigma 54-interacting transcriptional regulator [Xanthomonadaceae bacterium]